MIVTSSVCKAECSPVSVSLLWHRSGVAEVLLVRTAFAYDILPKTQMTDPIDRPGVLGTHTGVYKGFQLTRSQWDAYQIRYCSMQVNVLTVHWIRRESLNILISWETWLESRSVGVSDDHRNCKWEGSQWEDKRKTLMSLCRLTQWIYFVTTFTYERSCHSNMIVNKQTWSHAETVEKTIMCLQASRPFQPNRLPHSPKSGYLTPAWL